MKFGIFAGCESTWKLCTKHYSSVSQ